MAKLFIVCPKCSTKYPVADQRLAGKRVTCKKCSEKFVAEIQGAAPPPQEEAPLVPASDPLGDDLFGDFPTSESAAAAPALGALPSKQVKSSAGSFSPVPILLGAARVLVVAVVVVISFSSLYPSAQAGQGNASGRDVATSDRGSAPARNEGAFAPPSRNDAPSQPPRDARSTPPFGPSGFGQPPSPTPGRPDMGRPDMGRPFDPFGRGGRPPGMPGGGFGGENIAERAMREMESKYGADKLVRIECKSISSEQAKQIFEILEPEMIAKSTLHWFDPKIGERVLTFPYAGDINDLAAKITFGEVDQVLASERRIRLKSITLP